MAEAQQARIGVLRLIELVSTTLLCVMIVFWAIIAIFLARSYMTGGSEFTYLSVERIVRLILRWNPASGWNLVWQICQAHWVIIWLLVLTYALDIIRRACSRIQTHRPFVAGGDRLK